MVGGLKKHDFLAVYEGDWFSFLYFSYFVWLFSRVHVKAKGYDNTAAVWKGRSVHLVIHPHIQIDLIHSLAKSETDNLYFPKAKTCQIHSECVVC